MSANDDDLSKTMVIPNPGGRRTGSTGVPQATQSVFDAQKPATSAKQQTIAGSDSHLVFGENLTLAYARDLIKLASSIRTLEPNNTTEQLRFDINAQIEHYQKNLSEQGVPAEVSLTARYLLCCLIDELVLSTPWGIESAWSRQTLLSKYHNETSGGEKFFVLINKLMEQPQRNIDLIELCCLCLSIGFRGKYRLSQTGENDVLHLVNMLQQAIALYRPVSDELSPCWRSETQLDKHIGKRLPLSAVGIFLLFVCVSVYIALLSNLHAQSSSLFAKIESIAWDDSIKNTSSLQTTATQIPSVSSQVYDSAYSAMANNLQSAKDAGLIELIQQNDMIVLRFISSGLFASGSVQVNHSELPDRELLVNTINQYANEIVIVGHTDSSGRAESNWTISRQRAESIEAWFKQSGRASFQMLTRGVADTQPISQDPRDSANRRVELLIFLREGS